MAERQSTRSPGRPWIAFTGILTLIAALFLGAYLFFGRPSPCGVQFAPSPLRYSLEWWQCPIEINRHLRTIGDIGNVTLRGVSFSSDNRRGWVVGDDGTIISTTNGGSTWQRQVTNSKAQLSGVAFRPDGQLGSAFDDAGVVLTTTNGGSTWQAQTGTLKVSLGKASFAAGGQQGWAVGEDGTIYATVNGGATWQVKATNVGRRLSRVAFAPNGKQGWVVGAAGAILATKDGGSTWQKQVTNSDKDLYDIAVSADGERGWAVGIHGIVGTTDGGATWRQQFSMPRGLLVGVSFNADGQRGWAVGTDGTIVATTNGGSTWVSQRSNTQAQLYSVVFGEDGLHGWIAGHAGTILATVNGGSTWKIQASDLKSSLSSVTASADGTFAWAVGGGGNILLTSDGGASWQSAAHGSDATLLSVAFDSNGKHGWAVGFGADILVTNDGGLTWQPQVSGSKANLSGVVSSADGMRGLAVGQTFEPYGAAVLSTVDAGSTWRQLTNGLQGSSLSDVALNPDGQRGWAVGTTVLTTSDGGTTWQRQTRAGPLLNSVDFNADGQRGWTVGDAGTILATVDGGTIWKQLTSGTSVSLTSVAFHSDGQRGWVVGAEGTVLTTKNGGAIWLRQSSNTSRYLYDVTFAADGQHGWAVGESSTILSTRDGGLTWTSQASRYVLWPSPVYLAFTVLLLTICCVTVAFRIRSTSTTTLTDRILGRAVSDSPITRTDEDVLGFHLVAKAISAFLRHEATLPPITLAVTAAWGKGKSSLMRLLENDLQRSQQHTVWFNAWHHQKEPVLLASLLNAIVEQATPSWLGLRGWRFRTKLVYQRLANRPFSGALPAALWLLLTAVLLSLLLSGLLLAIAPTSALSAGAFTFWADLLYRCAEAITSSSATEALFAGEWARFARETLGAIGRDPAKGIPLLGTLWLFVSLFLLFTHFSRAFPARPSALLASLGPKFTLSQAEEQTSFRQRFREHFSDVVWALRPATLTIFIDDLDRCEPAKAAEMLESINYLTEAGPCVVVMGVAKEIVEAQLGESFHGLADRTESFDAARRAENSATFPLSTTSTTAFRWWRQAAKSTSKQAAKEKPATELEFVRRYLAKLIQVEVPVPSFQADGMRRIFLNSESEDALQEERQRALHCIEIAFRAQSLFVRFSSGAAIVAAIAACVVHGSSWLDRLERKQVAEHAQLRETVVSIELQVTSGARSYVNWLRREVEKLHKPAASKLSSDFQIVDAANKDGPTIASANTITASPLVDMAQSEASLEQAVLWLSRVDELCRLMRIQLFEGQLAAFDKSREQAEQLVKDLDTVANRDTSYRTALLAKAKGQPPDPPASSASLPANFMDVTPPRKTGNDQPTINTAIWSLGVPIGLVFFLMMVGVYFGRHRLRIADGVPYREALKACLPLLYALPSMKAPREAKRFVNLSRYLAVRIHAATYQTRLWPERFYSFLSRRKSTAVAVESTLDEAQIVVLTALHLARPASRRSEDPLLWLAKPWDCADIEGTEYARTVRKVVNQVGIADWPDDAAIRFFLDLLAEVHFDGSDVSAEN